MDSHPVVTLGLRILIRFSQAERVTGIRRDSRRCQRQPVRAALLRHRIPPGHTDAGLLLGKRKDATTGRLAVLKKSQVPPSAQGGIAWCDFIGSTHDRIILSV